MSTMSKKTDISLVNFFIFNSKFGPREGEEHKRILFFYPSTTDIDNQIKQIGLCEGIIKFAQTFTSKPCESLHTQKRRQLFYQPEHGFWMIMTVTIPCSQRTLEAQTVLEYHDDDVQDSVYRAIVQQSYNTFVLFNGSIEEILTKTDVDGLRQRFEHFFNKYLMTLQLNQADILDVFQGIHFLPLDKNTYLRVQCFINQMESTFPQLSYCAFLFNDQLVWSGLEQDDMRSLYAYVTTNLLPACSELELNGAHAANHGSQHGRFLLGPTNLNDESNMGHIPRVHLHGGEQLEECLLLAYRTMSATMLLMVNGEFVLTFDFLRRLDKFLSINMSAVASDLSDHCNKRLTSTTDIQFKYVYFNRMNLAQKTSLHAGGRKAAAVNVSSDLMRVITDISDDLQTVTAVEDGETLVKLASDCWVVGKKSDQREVYIVVNQKNANLIEINEEVKKLCSTHFSNIFFLD